MYVGKDNLHFIYPLLSHHSCFYNSRQEKEENLPQQFTVQLETCILKCRKSRVLYTTKMI